MPERVPCSTAGCPKPGKYLSLARLGPRVPVCASHYFSECTTDGCARLGITGGMCKSHKYGACTADGCESRARVLLDGQPVCNTHKYGTCTADGCGNKVVQFGMCNKHGRGSCTAPGCRNGANALHPATRAPLCIMHLNNGLDYVAVNGMKADADGLLYVVHNATLGAIKIGIGTAFAGRVRQHENYGWTSVWAREGDGLTIGEAREAERAVLAAWRAADVPVGALAHHMPQAGHTETAPGSEADALALAAWLAAGAAGEPPLPLTREKRKP